MACANFTCSAACHQEHFERSDRCTFHRHFAPGSPLVRMRSLTRQNIEFAESEKLRVGSPLNRTSRSYLFGMKHPEPGFIYAQRGFRQYGPVEVR